MVKVISSLTAHHHYHTFSLFSIKRKKYGSIFMIKALVVGGFLCGFNYKNEHPTELQNSIKCTDADWGRKGAGFLFSFFNQLLIICNCVPGERRENSLEQASGKWLQKVRHERFADTVHASRLRVEQGWCKNKTEERRRFAATVYSKVLAEFLTFGSG